MKTAPAVVLLGLKWPGLSAAASVSHWVWAAWGGGAGPEGGHSGRLSILGSSSGWDSRSSFEGGLGSTSQRAPQCLQNWHA